MNTPKVWDIAVIGAGAAGLITAVTARRGGLNVLLLDGKAQIGAKILMSGGTRCNLTNETVTEKDFQSDYPNAVKSAVRQLSSEEAVGFFKELGVSVVLEAGGKYFPSTHSGRTVLDAFMKEIERLGVVLKTGQKATGIVFKNSLFEISGQDFVYQAKNVVLTTGGLSFPGTGSDGTGYGLAAVFGHTMIATSPSLTPLETGDAEWKALSGVALPVRLSLLQGGKKKASYEGDFLFTHFGFSGPVVLNISRHWIRAEKTPDLKLSACFLPGLHEEAFREQIARAAAANPTVLLKTILSEFLPKRLAETILKKLRISQERILNQLKREERESLIQFIYHCPLPVTGDAGYKKAEVTAGGVNLKEVDSVTFESKLQPGLYFAGEILDADGRIGGFNFQWAWSTGFAAARAVIKKLAKT